MTWSLRNTCKTIAKSKVKQNKQKTTRKTTCVGVKRPQKKELRVVSKTRLQEGWSKTMRTTKGKEAPGAASHFKAGTMEMRVRRELLVNSVCLYSSTLLPGHTQSGTQ